MSAWSPVCRPGFYSSPGLPRIAMGPCHATPTPAAACLLGVCSVSDMQCHPCLPIMQETVTTTATTWAVNSSPLVINSVGANLGETSQLRHWACTHEVVEAVLWGNGGYGNRGRLVETRTSHILQGLCSISAVMYLRTDCSCTFLAFPAPQSTRPASARLMTDKLAGSARSKVMYAPLMQMTAHSSAS